MIIPLSYSMMLAYLLQFARATMARRHPARYIKSSPVKGADATGLERI